MAHPHYHYPIKTPSTACSYRRIHPINRKCACPPRSQPASQLNTRSSLNQIFAHYLANRVHAFARVGLIIVLRRWPEKGYAACCVSGATTSQSYDARCDAAGWLAAGLCFVRILMRYGAFAADELGQIDQIMCCYDIVVYDHGRFAEKCSGMSGGSFACYTDG